MVPENFPLGQKTNLINYSLMQRKYGNTSSSSIWYELNFIEKSHHVKKGERIWQIAFGSGFKCNSAVWVALRNIS